MKYSIYEKRSSSHFSYAAERDDIESASEFADSRARQGWTVVVMNAATWTEVYRVAPTQVAPNPPDPKLLRLYRAISDLIDCRDHVYNFTEMGETIDGVIAAYEEIKGGSA